MKETVRFARSDDPAAIAPIGTTVMAVLDERATQALQRALIVGAADEADHFAAARSRLSE
jgi:hypothetical protein